MPLGFGQVWKKLLEKHEGELSEVGSGSRLDWGQESKGLGGTKIKGSCEGDRFNLPKAGRTSFSP